MTTDTPKTPMYTANQLVEAMLRAYLAGVAQGADTVKFGTLDDGEIQRIIARCKPNAARVISLIIDEMYLPQPGL